MARGTYWYHENGQIEQEGNYKDDKLDGKWTWWHENGQIESRGKLQRRQSRWQGLLIGMKMVRKSQKEITKTVSRWQVDLLA